MRTFLVVARELAMSRLGLIPPVVLGLICCDGDTTGPRVEPVAWVHIDPLRASFKVNQTFQLTATPTGESGDVLSGRTMAWSSSNTSVATVSDGGLVTGVAAGTAIVSASSEGKSGPASVAVVEPLPFTLVSAGLIHTCGLTKEGDAYCWGNGQYGGLGDGSTEARLVPTLVSGDLTFETISAGFYHTCGLTTSSEAYCWGSGGALGNGSTDLKPVPTMVSGGLTFETVSAGVYHTCGVTAEGEAYCWGDGSFGKLGNKDSSPHESELVPTLVLGELTFISISAGFHHTCGVTTGGEAYCWGDGWNGQLGNGSRMSKLVPTMVSGDLVFSTVDAGLGFNFGVHTCGVTTDGKAYCWGSGEDGRLGNGSRELKLHPTPVSGGLIFESVSSGRWHTCGVTTTGDGVCWGSGWYGQLGNGSPDGKLAPESVSGGLAFATVSAGDLYTCGVTRGNDAYCWGTGSLGTGTLETIEPVPTLVWGRK